MVSIPLALSLLFQSSVVQTLTARFAADILSKNLEQEVGINSIKIGIFSGINVSGLEVKDHHNNILLGVGKLVASPVLSNFSLSEINFISIKLDSVQFNMGSYKGEDTSNLSYLLNKILSGEKSGNTFELYSGKLQLSNSTFNLFNQNKEYVQGERTMDYANILIHSINANIDDFKLINDSLNFKVLQLSAEEQCGIVVKNLSADFIISSTGLYTNNSIINLNNSDIDADFGMEYSNYKSFGYYIDSVNMTGNVHPTIIDMADIGYFADILFEMPNIVGLTGKFDGTVSDLKGIDLKIKYGKNTRVSGDISFKGLPDFFTSYITGNNLRFTSNTNDIKEFYLPISSKHIDLTGIIPGDDQVTAIGDFKGYYEDFYSNLTIILDQGSILSSINFKSTPNLIDFNTSLIADTVDIGDFLDQKSLLGDISFDLDFSGKGESLETMAYSLSGKLSNTELLNYTYSRIGVHGKYSNDSVIADIRVGDRNLMMTASANVVISEVPKIDLKSNIVVANLNKLNLWFDQKISISTNIDANVTGIEIGSMEADIALRNNNLVFRENKYLVDSIILSLHTNSQEKTSLQLLSDIINLDATGKYNPSTVTQSIINVFDHYYNIAPGDDSTRLPVDENIVINLEIPKPELITKEFLFGATLSPKTNLSSSFNFTNNNINVDFSSDRILIGDVKLDSSNFKIINSNDHLLSEFSISSIILKDSTPTDSLVFGIDDFSISAILGNDSVIYGINWDNRVQELKNSGVLEGYITQYLDSTKLSVGKANIYINDTDWSIDSNNLVVIHNGQVYFSDFMITAGVSEFNLFGTIPKTENDSLVAQFKDWQLSYFDLITKPINIDLDGEINGQLNLSIKHDNPMLVSNLSIKDLGLNNEYLGDANIMNIWDNSSNSIFIKSDIIRKGNAGEGEIFKATGYYHPTKKKDNLDIDVSFNRFKIKAFEPFLEAFISNLEGTTSGEIEVRGSVKKPIITGSANMQRTGMRVLYTNTKYSFSNSIDFVENRIKFDKLELFDTLGNHAQIDGNLDYTNLSDPKFDVQISTPGLLFFNTSEHMNDLFYGSAIASGNIKMTGNPRDIDLSINVKTQKGTSVVLPLNYSVEISDKDYIIFTKKDVDTISEDQLVELTTNNSKDELKYNLDVNLEVTPIAEVGITLPNDMGTIQARGKSNLSISVNSDGKFDLIGDYIVQDGLFQFKIGNLVSKRFSLVEGGRISWSGNAYSANVNIKGLYKVKTSLSNLGVAIDTTVSYKNKVTVECYVVLTDELLNPNIKFEIKIPNLDPDQQRAVFSELDTTNTAMMNQQMISLLVLGSFNFNNAANVSLQSSYYNVIANQLSSMLSQISDKVDVGLNYKPGDAVSQEEFEVALSTQLFDDRLTIDGNFGMTYDRTDQSASNIVGDVDIGYKLTPDGQWVLKVFNHSNVNSWYNYNNYDQTSPYTQGVGIAFRRDFNNIKELFTSRKKKANKKEQEDTDNKSTKSEDEVNETP